MVLSEWEMVNLLNHIYQNITVFRPGVYSNNKCFILKFKYNHIGDQSIDSFYLNIVYSYSWQSFEKNTNTISESESEVFIKVVISNFLRK